MASLLRLRALRVSNLQSTPSLLPSSRHFHAVSARQALSESARGTSQGEASELEKLKQNSLKGAKSGKGEFEAGLASDSESAVKADRGEHPGAEETEGMVGKVEGSIGNAAKSVGEAVKKGVETVKKSVN